MLLFQKSVTAGALCDMLLELCLRLRQQRLLKIVSYKFYNFLAA